MVYASLIVRTLLTYLIILIVFRFMGKREIGELSVMDLVVFIMLAEIGVFIIEQPDSSIWKAIVPMAVLLAIQLGSAWVSLKNQRFRTWFDGKPSVIIKHGMVDEYEMKRQRYNFNDLLIQLREHGIQQVNDVAYAILEPSGKLSVFEKDESGHSSYAVVLIADGQIQYSGLKNIRKNKNWLLNELKKQGYESVDQISLCTINEEGEVSIDEKNQYK
ncbi:YetF domain-containing protein [Halobacillus sp. K22]|uniref:YetF domain-containing protein n=1 Tax=Halobacillus sp. K22 TaxID=3457431 RepID=UPI003FCCD110